MIKKKAYEIQKLIDELGLVEVNKTPVVDVEYMNTSDFNDALKVEKSFQPYADKFYKENLCATTIKRYDWNDPIGQEYQKKDIDCSVEIYAPGIDVFWLNISEKFRQVDCGDMCIELWSDFERKKLGWGLTGQDVDMFLYWTPSNIYEVWKGGWCFQSVVQEILREWPWERVNEELKKMKRNNSKNIRITAPTGCVCDVGLLRCWTKDKYYGVCVCIPWKSLMYEFLLDIGKYKWTGENYIKDKI